MVRLSIIIPVLNEEQHISACLESLLSMEYPQDFLELIIVDGASTDRTVEIVKTFEQKFHHLIILTNFQKYVPISLNMAIAKATGKYIVRLDAHSIYASNYLSILLKWALKTKAANVGAVCYTGQKKGSFWGRAFSFVLSDKMGVGNSHFRTGIVDPREVDTVPFGFFRRDTFEIYGLFNEKLHRNQDIEFNSRIISKGGKVLLVPDTNLTYFPPSDLYRFMKKNYSNGLWNIKTCSILSNFTTLKLRHFIPLVFVVSLMFLIIGSFFSALFLKGLVIFISLYVGSLFIRALYVQKNIFRAIKSLFAFLGLHIPYGIGSIIGCFIICQHRKSKT